MIKKKHRYAADVRNKNFQVFLFLFKPQFTNAEGVKY